MNPRRCGVDNLIHGPGKIDHREHAARQLSRPLQTLGLCVDDLSAKLYLSAEDRDAANAFLGHCARPIVAFHPGSGGERKNWPLENWIDLGNRLLAPEDFRGSIVIVSGEADINQVARLQSIWKYATVRFAKNLPLPHLAAVLEQTIFIGHDSGISHLAAAAGANCVLLFGPTDPNVWAPRNKNVRVLRTQSGKLSDLEIADVEAAVASTLGNH